MRTTLALKTLHFSKISFSRFSFSYMLSVRMAKARDRVILTAFGSAYRESRNMNFNLFAYFMYGSSLRSFPDNHDRNYGFHLIQHEHKAANIRKQRRFINTVFASEFKQHSNKVVLFIYYYFFFCDMSFTHSPKTNQIIGDCFVRNTLEPAGIYLFKGNNANARIICEICLKLTVKAPERRQ